MYNDNTSEVFKNMAPEQFSVSMGFLMEPKSARCMYT